MFRANRTPLNAYAGTWIVMAGMGVLALGGAAFLGFSFDRASAVNAAITAAIPVTLHLFYTRIRPDIYIGPVCGAAAVLYLSSIVGGTMSLVALGTGVPLADAPLAWLDASMGFHVGKFTAFLAQSPAAILLLRVCYSGIVPAIMLTAVILVLIKRSDRLWEFCFVYAGALTTCALISAFVPAIGAFRPLFARSRPVERLPQGAGVYYLSQFVAFRFEGQRIIDLLDFQGVVNLPSFHCCMALLTAYAYRGMARISVFVYAFSALVIVSCVPIGGHYLSDIVAGAAVWGAFVAMTRLRPRVAPHGHASISAARPASLEATPEQLATR